MKIGGRTLILAGLALAALAPASAGSGPSAQSGSAVPITIIEHPRQYLAQAYPADPLPLPGVADDRSFAGIRQGEPNARAVPGILSLATKLVSGVPRLDIDRFVTSPPNSRPFVQSYRLTKDVPASEKCPGTFQSRTYHQFGPGIRTWWALQFTPPGTLFTLDVTVRYLDPRSRKVAFQIDRWTWEVVATLDSLENLIYLLHTDAVGTTEVPCILGEDLFEALVASMETLRTAKVESRQAFQDALFNMEGLVTALAVFGEVVEGNSWFAAGPPGNASVQTDLGLAGLLESAENPCACKILVDLEYIARKA